MAPVSEQVSVSEWVKLLGLESAVVLSPEVVSGMKKHLH